MNLAKKDTKILTAKVIGVIISIFKDKCWEKMVLRRECCFFW